MANPARNPDSRPDPLDPERRSTDPLAPDPRLSPATSRTVNRVESRTGTGILIAAVVLVLALIAYFAFAPGDETVVAPDGSTVTEQPADTAPAPDATAPAAPADTAPAPDATAPAAPADTAPAPDATAPAAPADTAPAAPSDSTAPAPESTAPAEPAPAPAQ